MTTRMLPEHCQHIGGPDGANLVLEVVPQFANIVEVLRAGTEGIRTLTARAAMASQIRFCAR
jgi:hypothetical protein